MSELESYEEMEEKYNASVSRIRSFLAATRSRSTLQECDRLLKGARQLAARLQEISGADKDIESNSMEVRQAQQRFERELGPLEQGVSRALGLGLSSNSSSNNNNSKSSDGNPNRSNGHAPPGDLFYQAPPQAEPYFVHSDTEQLIQSSEDLLRESQALCVDSEGIGNSTLFQMGRQREQLQISSDRANETLTMTMEAKLIMSRLARRAFKNKLVLYGIILALVVANIMAFVHLYHRYKKH